MDLTWLQKLDIQWSCPADKYGSALKTLAKSKLNLGQKWPQHGPNMGLVGCEKIDTQWTCPLDQIDSVLKIAELYLL